MLFKPFIKSLILGGEYMKKLFVISVFFILMYCLSAVCAADVSETCENISADMEYDFKLSGDSCSELNSIDESNDDLAIGDMEDKFTVSGADEVKLSQDKENSVSSNSSHKNSLIVNDDNSFLSVPRICMLQQINMDKVSSTADSFTALNILIDKCPENSVIDLNHDYTGDCCLSINKNLTIDGHGHSIEFNHKNLAIFCKSGNIVLKNLKITNADDCALPVVNFWENTCGTIINCTFSNNIGTFGGAVYLGKNSKVEVNNCSFINNSGRFGGAIYTLGELNVYNSYFEDNHGDEGGAINGFIFSSINIENSVFINNNAEQQSVIHSDNTVNVLNSKFIDNHNQKGYLIYAKGILKFIDCTVVDDYNVISDLGKLIRSEKRVVNK